MQDVLRQALEQVAALGPWGLVLFVLLYVAACVLFVPGLILTLGAGAVFGLVRGLALVSVASTLGATAAFLVGRYLLRGWVERRIQGDARFRAIDEAVGREGWKIVGLTRLTPVLPFNLLNYAYGVTKVSLRDYVLASWIGMLPGTLLYVYLGVLTGDIARLGAGMEMPATPAVWALRAVGLAATVGVAVLVTRIARQALREQGVAP